MRQCPYTPETPVTEVLSVYLQAHATYTPYQSRRQWAKCLDSLRRFLKREPLMADLDAGTIARFSGWINLPDKRVIVATQNRFSRMLVSLRDFAEHFRKGYDRAIGWDAPDWTKNNSGGGKKTGKPLRTVPAVSVKKLKPTDTLEQLMFAYRLLRLAGAGEGTHRKYRIVLGFFRKALGREPLIEDLNEESIAVFVAYVTARKSSTDTLHGYRCKLRALWEFAARKKILDEFPDLQTIRRPRRIPVGFTLDQLNAIFAEAGRQRGRIAGVPASDWLQALLLILWQTGERISATLSIQWEWVDLDSGWLSIPAECRKGQAEDMQWRLGPDAIAAVRKIRQPERALVFPWERTMGALWLRWKGLLKRAGCPTGRKFGFHAVRRSSGSFVRAAGGDATAHLGHISGPAMTQRYLIPSIVGTQHAADILPRLEGPRSA